MAEGSATNRMSIVEVPVLPLRASRHLAAWIVWQTARVSLLDDAPTAPPPNARKRSGRSSASRMRR